MKRFFLIIFFFLLFSIINYQSSISRPAVAAGEFETNYNLRYQVNPDGLVHVNQDISLTNKLSRIYATKYSLTLPSTEVRNINASDNGGPCKTEVTQNGQTTNIVINFNEQVVGAGKTFNFNLNWDVYDVARKNGEIWEINVPKIANVSDVDNYSILIAVPANFGKPAFIRPEPIETLTEANFNLYRFVKSQLSESGVNAAFGPFQIFDFTLFYHLQNPNLTTGETEIALPPDNAFQRLTYQKIDPHPLNIRVDEDGNWLAKYRLKPKEKVNITVTGKVKLFAQPQKDFPPPRKETLDKNLLAAKYWESDNPEIIKIAQNLKTPQQIYDYVVQTLNYDFDRVKNQAERFGALKTLQNPNQAICMEFTDLFVALARAAGIPARGIDGFAYTTDAKLRPLSLMADILHAWPEYYNVEKQAWIPVDPTWGKTTGGVDYFSKTDLNHFSFVIHGESSESPYPAGAYKLEDTIGKDVQVGFGEYQGEDKKDLKVQFDLPKEIFWGENKKGIITFKNEGQSAFYNLEIEVRPQDLALLPAFTKKMAILPPFSSIELPVELKSKNIFTTGWSSINVKINNQEYAQKIKVGSFFWQIILPWSGFIITLSALLIILRKKL